MASATAGRRYAQAIFGLASEKNTIDAWLNDLQVIAEVSQHPRAAEYLSNPKVPFEKKEEVAARLFPSVQPQALNLVRMLLTRQRFELAPSIFAAYEELVNQMRGIAQAEVTTAVPLSDQEAEQLRERLSAATGKQIILNRKVDPEIIGGMVARIGDQLIDGSTRTRLSQLRRTLAGITR